MLKYAHSLAEQRGITCLREAKTDFDAYRCFLYAHAARPQLDTSNYRDDGGVWEGSAGG